MAHILEFTVESLAGRNDTVHFKLNRDLNIFHGVNGRGKTSLLKILHSAMSGDANILRNVPFSYATVKIYSIAYDRVINRSIKKEGDLYKKASGGSGDHYGISESAGAVLHEKKIENFNWSQDFESEDGMANFRHRYLPTSRLYPTLDQRHSNIHRQYFSEREIVGEDALNTYFAESISRLWDRYSADILQAVGDSQREGLASILKAVLSSSVQKGEKIKDDIPLEKSYQVLKQFLIRQGSPKIIGTFSEFKKRYEEEISLQQIVRDVHLVESKIEQIMSPKRKIGELIYRLYGEGKNIDFTDRELKILDKNNKELDLAGLSSGEKHLLLMLIDSLIAEANSIMIDEPEISLHIDWQREFIDIIRILNPQAQYIIASHAPEIMAEIPDDKIIKL